MTPQEAEETAEEGRGGLDGGEKGLREGGLGGGHVMIHRVDEKRELREKAMGGHAGSECVDQRTKAQQRLLHKRWETARRGFGKDKRWNVDDDNGTGREPRRMGMMKKRLRALLVGPVALGWRDICAQKQKCLGSLPFEEFQSRR